MSGTLIVTGRPTADLYTEWAGHRWLHDQILEFVRQGVTIATEEGDPIGDTAHALAQGLVSTSRYEGDDEQFCVDMGKARMASGTPVACLAFVPPGETTPVLERMRALGMWCQVIEIPPLDQLVQQLARERYQVAMDRALQALQDAKGYAETARMPLKHLIASIGFLRTSSCALCRGSGWVGPRPCSSCRPAPDSEP